jgi:hypothetical protein
MLYRFRSDPGLSWPHASLQPFFHAFNQVRLRGGDEQMVMVLHEDIGMGTPASFFTRLRQGLEEPFPIFIILKVDWPSLPRAMT